MSKTTKTPTFVPRLVDADNLPVFELCRMTVKELKRLIRSSRAKSYNAGQTKSRRFMVAMPRGRTVTVTKAALLESLSYYEWNEILTICDDCDGFHIAVEEEFHTHIS